MTGARDRGETPVLVVEAHTLGAVAVIRSLGRAGFPVHACSWQQEALGFRSSFASASVQAPRYESTGYCDWLAQYVDRQRIKVIIPSESFLLAIRPRFQEFRHLLPIPQYERTAFAALSKVDVAEALGRDGALGKDHVPPQQIITSETRLETELHFERFTFPLFAKVDAIYSRACEGSRVVTIPDPDRALPLLKSLQRRYEKVLLQGYVPGHGVGVFFLLWGGEILAEFMHRRIHEVPHTGGVSSLRESFYCQRIRDDGLGRLRQLGWQGVAMLEYRRDDATGGFHFIELNARFWGSLHLALYSGVDFPALLVDAHCGRPVVPQRRYPLGLRCRHTFPAELQHLWSKLKDRQVAWRAKIAAIGEFALLSVDPRVRSDLLFPRDRSLYFEALRRMLHLFSMRHRRKT